MQSANDFHVDTPEGSKPIFEVDKRGEYLFDWKDDAEMSEYFVPVKWLQTVPLERPVYEVGLFGNQNSVCKPTTPKWRSTVDRLKELLPKYNDLHK